MFNMGFSEILVIGVVALLVIGPKQLPEVAKVVGRLLGELRQATAELGGGLLQVKNEVENTIHETKADIIREGQKFADSVTKEQTSSESNTENIDETKNNKSHEDMADAVSLEKDDTGKINE